MSKLLSKEELIALVDEVHIFYEGWEPDWIKLINHIDAQAAEIEWLKGRIETLKAALMDFICDARDDPRAFASAVYLADDELAKE